MNGADQHVCLFVPTLEGGGAERVAVTLANEFARRGLRVTMLLVRSGGVYTADVAAGVEIVELGGGGVMGAIPALRRWLRRERPAAILSLMRHTNVAAVIAHLLAGRCSRLVVSERVSLAHQHENLRDRLVYWLAKFAYRRADHVTTVTAAMQREIMGRTGLPEERVTTIYNPVIDPTFLQWLDDREARLHPWAIAPKEALLIAAAGRLEWQKGHDVLLDAFSQLRALRPEARLVIFGEGALRGALEAQAARLGLTAAVALAGFWANPFPSIARSDLFVLSSRSEGLPGTLIQAMACGVPVVSTDCPTGPAEILEDGRWGQLVPVDDAKALARAMDVALSAKRHPDVKARSSAFGADAAVDRYLKVLLG